MKIDDLISLIEEMKNDGADEVFLTKESIIENVANDFRPTYVWLDGYNKNESYVNSIEIEVED